MATADNLERYQQILERASSKEELYQAIVNVPFDNPLVAAQLFLGIVVLLLVNPKTKMIDRIALSDTHLAKGTVKVSVKRFEDIKIPVDYPDNLIAEAVRTNQAQVTTDWQYLFAPALTPQEARFNQAAGGIGYSAIYPFKAKRAQGALIYSYFQYPENISRKQQSFMEHYTQLVREQWNRIERKS